MMVCGCGWDRWDRLQRQRRVDRQTRAHGCICRGTKSETGEMVDLGCTFELDDDLRLSRTLPHVS